MRQRLEGLGRIPPRQQQVQIQFRQQHGVAQIIFLRQRGQQLAELANLIFALQNDG